MVKPSDILRLSNFFCCRHVASQAAPKSLVQLKSLELPEHASRGRGRSIDGDSGGHRLRWYTMGVQALRMFGRYPDDNTMYIYIWYLYIYMIYIYDIYIWYMIYDISIWRILITYWSTYRSYRILLVRFWRKSRWGRWRPPKILAATTGTQIPSRIISNHRKTIGKPYVNGLV